MSQFSKKVFGKAAALGVIVFVAVILAGMAGCSTVSGSRAPIDRGVPLTMDSAVVSGTLGNGMSYHVLENKEPENRIFLRLVVRAGSINEDDDQRGVAHFVEHLGFNGSEHFAENELIDYFESIGMSFGPEVNAYTSFEETVYMLEIPADDPEMLATSMLVLKDWASALTFDPVELEKERNVIVEEWRLGRGVQGRIMDKVYPFIAEGSRYAERLPIGDMDTIRTISRERVVDFYKTWYRPELMSVVVVGDEKPQVIIEAIEQSFGLIPPSDTFSENTESAVSDGDRYPVPERKKPAVLVVRDPEITYTTVEIAELFPYRKQEYTGDVRTNLIQQMAYLIFNNRLTEKTITSDPLMLSAWGGIQSITAQKSLGVLAMVPSPGRFEEAMQELLTELLRIETFGVTETELSRMQAEFLAFIEQTWLNRDKQPSASRASTLVNALLYGEPMRSIEDVYEVWQEFVPGITADDISQEIQNWFTGRGKMLMITAPEGASDIPGDRALLNLWQKWKPKNLTAYEDTVFERPLFDPADFPILAESKDTGDGAVVSEQTLTKEGIIEWTLSNGARVLVLPTQWKSDEILFSALSKGGTSLASDADYPSAAALGDYAAMSGLNGFSLVELEKLLAGKTVGFDVWISEAWEGISGSSSNQELETLFQLIFLIFTNPTFTNEGWDSLMANYNTIAESRRNNPDEQFSDLKIDLLYGDNIRKQNISPELIAAMRQDVSIAFSHERIANAGDFTFVFVGSFDTDLLRELAETYIAPLPSTGVHEEARYMGSGFPQGITEGEVHAGIDPKSRVFMAFGGEPVSDGAAISEDFAYERFDALISLMNIRLREIIREDVSGTYGVSVSGYLSSYPKQEYRITIDFGCEPGREEELSNMILSEIASFRTKPVAESYMTKIS
ncbi:MAG: insulinase family protein, partial [Spirochaetaceae bacterium]|nr:insulinase family protein [Spirochaetaceae bacterium]